MKAVCMTNVLVTEMVLYMTRLMLSIWTPLRIFGLPAVTFIGPSSIDTSRRRYQREEYNTCKNKQEIIMTHIPFKVSLLRLVFLLLPVTVAAQEARLLIT